LHTRVGASVSSVSLWLIICEICVKKRTLAFEDENEEEEEEDSP